MMSRIASMGEKVLGEYPTSTPTQPKLDQTRPMHALVWHGKKDIRYVETPRPMITDSKDIILKVTASTICGSDLHLYSGAMPGMQKGDILGHEFLGTVEEVGSQVKNLSVGQRVVVAFDIACGVCDFCKREEYTACDTTNPSKEMELLYGDRTSALYGYSHLTGGVPGGQAEYVRVPFADVNCLPIPDEVPDEKALYLSDIVPTAYHGVALGKVKEGSTVAIWGLGPVGLLIARWAQILKAGRIIGIDRVPERLDRARHLGIELINFDQEDTVARVREMVPGGVDVAIEAAGFEYAKTTVHKIERTLSLETDTADVLTECIRAVRKFGIVSVIGVYVGLCNHFPIGALMEKGVTITGSQSPTQKYWKMALEKIKSGEMDPTFVISHKARLADGPILYEKFYNKDEVIKVFIRP